jgi:hypothetical protein
MANIQYLAHTFILRTAPAQSSVAGEVCGELRCSMNHSAIRPLNQLGIEAEILEKYQHPIGGWKVLRFRTTIDGYTKLIEACRPSDIDERADETEDRLAAMIVDVAQAIASLPEKELIAA